MTYQRQTYQVSTNGTSIVWNMQTLLLLSDRKPAIWHRIQHDFDVHFQGHEFWKINISKTVKASENRSSITAIEVDICHRMKPLQMLYSVNWTFIFKVKHFLLLTFAMTNCVDGRCSRQIFLDLYGLATWSCSCSACQINLWSPATNHRNAEKAANTVTDVEIVECVCLRIANVRSVCEFHLFGENVSLTNEKWARSGSTTSSLLKRLT